MQVCVVTLTCSISCFRTTSEDQTSLRQRWQPVDSMVDLERAQAAPAAEIWFSVFSPGGSPQDAAAAQATTRGRSISPPELSSPALLEQRLKEEERLLLAKLHHMTGGVPPVSGPRSMRRLIPDHCDPGGCPTGAQSSGIRQFDRPQVMSLTQPMESKPLGQKLEE